MKVKTLLGVHAFLKDQYEAHLEQFDTLAEFIQVHGLSHAYVCQGISRCKPWCSACI
jgi:ferredoxin